MEKLAPVDYPIHELLRRRWSPRAFAPRSIDALDLLSIFEAARWAASSANEQPWRFLVALRDDPEEFARMLACLVPGNQRWAQNAGALVLTVAHLNSERSGKPNAYAWHDTGMALAHMLLEATSRRLAVHPMAGFDAAAARAAYSIPEEFAPVAALAIGHPASPDTLPQDLRERELAPRVRRALGQMVYERTWERAAAIVAG